MTGDSNLGQFKWEFRRLICQHGKDSELRGVSEHYLPRNLGAHSLALRIIPPAGSYLAIIQHDRLNAAGEAGRSFHLRRVHVGRRRAAQIEIQRQG